MQKKIYLAKKKPKKIKKKLLAVSNECKGFTLLEVLMVIGIIAILAGVVLVAVNPNRQFKIARDSQRVSNMNAIVNAVGQNMIDHKGVFTCLGLATAIPTSASSMKSGGGVGSIDIAPCLVPDYLAAMPYDPSLPGAKYISNADYDTAYVIYQDPNGRITASSTGEITSSIHVTR